MRVLIIDDDKVTLEALKLSLEKEGHTVTTGESGYQALSLLENKTYDFILCDVFMPDLSGFVVGNLLQDSWHIPIVFMSSDKFIGPLILQTFGENCEFINKPVTIPELMEKVGRHLQPLTTH